MKLFLHNQFAYNKLVSSLKTNHRACIVQPTGTGKSYIIAEFLKENPNSRVLIITASDYIITQFNNSFSHLYSNYDIKTYPSLLSRIFESLLQRQYDYIILDEYHRGGAFIWGNKLFELINNNSNAKIVGLTATYLRNEFNSEGDYRNMADELFDGNLVYNLSLREAFDVGILPTPKYIKALYDLGDEYQRILEVINKSKAKNKGQLKERILEKKLQWENSNGAETILKKHLNKEKNFIVFCNTIDHLYSMIPIVENWFSKLANRVNVFKIYSEYKDQNKEFQNFAKQCENSDNSINLLFAVDMLNEGIHVKNIDGVIFLRPTDSHIIYFQQLGRCLETMGNQPIVFDFVNNFNTNIIAEDFHSKKNNEERVITEEFILQEYEKYKFDFQIIDEVEDYKNIFNNTLEETDLWNIHYNSIKNKLVEGSTYKVLTKTEKSFLKNQRKFFVKDQLDQNKIHLLNELNNLLEFDWKIGINAKGVNYVKKLKDKIKEGRKEHSNYIKSALGSARKLYDNEENSEIAKLMDEEITPILGYDWRKPQIKRLPFFDKALLMKRKIKNNQELNSADKVWFRDLSRKEKSKRITEEEKEIIKEIKVLYNAYKQNKKE